MKASFSERVMDNTPMQTPPHNVAALEPSFLTVKPTDMPSPHSPASRVSVSMSATDVDSDDDPERSPKAVTSALPDIQSPRTPDTTSPRFPSFPALRRNRSREGDVAYNRSMLLGPAQSNSASVHVPCANDLEDDEETMKCGGRFLYPIPEPLRDPWEVVNNLLEDNDKTMCARWKEMIDKQLFFAGLFSATVVAFLVVSYQLLQPNPMEVQQAIGIQLMKILVHYNTTGSLPSLDYTNLASSPSNYKPPPAVLRMNAAWFLSMTLALTTVLVGTICLQWIREYERDSRQNPIRQFAMRQMRWESLHFWKVPLIISSLSLLLQLALLLFFWGLLEFLWSLNSLVTMINSVVIGIVMFFFTATVCVPALQTVFASVEGVTGQLRGHQSPYKSPQARVVTIVAVWAALRVIRLLRFFCRCGRRNRRGLMEMRMRFLERIQNAGDWDDWVAFDIEWHNSRMPDGMMNELSAGATGAGQAPVTESCDIPRGLAMLGNTYIHNKEGMYALYYLLRKNSPWTTSLMLRKLNDTSGGLPSTTTTTTTESLGHSILTDKRYKDILADLHGAFLLGHVVRSGQDPMQQETLMIPRTELFIRIAYYCADHILDSTSIPIPQQWQQAEMGRFVDKCLCEKDCGINPFVGNDDFERIPHNMLRQILVVFRTLLGRAWVFHRGLWEIVKPIVVYIVINDPPSDGYLVHEMSMLNRKLLYHYQDNSTTVADPPTAQPTSSSDHLDVPGRSTSGTRTHRALSSEQKLVKGYVLAVKDGLRKSSGRPGSDFMDGYFMSTFKTLEKACCSQPRTQGKHSSSSTTK